MANRMTYTDARIRRAKLEAEESNVSIPDIAALRTRLLELLSEVDEAENG